MPEEKEKPVTKKKADEVNPFTQPSPPPNPAYDAEGRLIDDKQHKAEQAAREAILLNVPF